MKKGGLGRAAWALNTLEQCKMAGFHLIATVGKRAALEENYLYKMDVARGGTKQ